MVTYEARIPSIAARTTGSKPGSFCPNSPCQSAKSWLAACREGSSRNDHTRSCPYARQWALADRQLAWLNPVSEDYVRELHRYMFDQTWRWAGTYRKTGKNLGAPVHQIREKRAQLLGNAAYWIGNKTYEVDGCAARFHHELVVIHAFPNGNGGRARLIADVIAVKNARQFFSWGGKDAMAPGEARDAYLRALRDADQGHFELLLRFARS